MKSQDIQKVIDRMVGTRGTLRIPAWWMRKILSDLVKYCEGMDDTKAVEDLKTALEELSLFTNEVSKRVGELESQEPFQIVSELPSEPKDNVVYLIPSANGEGSNVLTEWVCINGVWEQFGEFKADVDLSEYVKKTELYALAQKVAALEEIINQITTVTEE